MNIPITKGEMKVFKDSNKSFLPTGKLPNRKSRRQSLQKYRDKMYKMVIVGTTRFKVWKQVINFFNEKTGKQEIRLIEHSKAV